MKKPDKSLERDPITVIRFSIKTVTKLILSTFRDV